MMERLRANDLGRWRDRFLADLRRTARAGAGLYLAAGWSSLPARRRPLKIFCPAWRPAPLRGRTAHPALGRALLRAHIGKAAFRCGVPQGPRRSFDQRQRACLALRPRRAAETRKSGTIKSASRKPRPTKCRAPGCRTDA